MFVYMGLSDVIIMCISFSCVWLYYNDPIRSGHHESILVSIGVIEAMHV